MKTKSLVKNKERIVLFFVLLAIFLCYVSNSHIAVYGMMKL